MSPEPGQVLVAIRAAGVNPVDTYIRSGAHAIRPDLPYTPGEDAAGVIVAVGSGVESVARGDRVYVAGSITGTYAEHALCLEEQVHPLPAHLTFAQGAAVGVPYATAYRALFMIARASPGETILVHGASGAVGIAAVQFARAAGLTIIGTAGTQKGEEAARAAGAHHVLDHHAPDAAQRIMGLTGGRGVDVVVEMLANLNLERDLSMVAMRGRIVLVGSRGRIEIDPRAAMVREATISGVFHYNTPPREQAIVHKAIVAALEANVARPVVGAQFPLAAARDAHELVLRGGASGKIVLIPAPGGSCA